MEEGGFVDLMLCSICWLNRKQHELKLESGERERERERERRTIPKHCG